jgi:hypothetical protein
LSSGNRACEPQIAADGKARGLRALHGEIADQIDGVRHEVQNARARGGAGLDRIRRIDPLDVIGPERLGRVVRHDDCAGVELQLARQCQDGVSRKGDVAISGVVDRVGAHRAGGRVEDQRGKATPPDQLRRDRNVGVDHLSNAVAQHKGCQVCPWRADLSVAQIIRTRKMSVRE